MEACMGKFSMGSGGRRHAIAYASHKKTRESSFSFAARNGLIVLFKATHKQLIAPSKITPSSG